MLEDEKCLIGSPCKHCDPEVCKYYKRSYNSEKNQDEKEKLLENKKNQKKL